MSDQPPISRHDDDEYKKVFDAADAQETDAYLNRIAAERELEEEAEQVRKAAATHHDPGSPEEAHSRRVRFDKYIAMQALLIEIAHCAPADNHAAHFGPRAKAILAGMQPTFRTQAVRSTADRAKDRARVLEALAFAYQLVARLHPDEPELHHRSAALSLEALQAWERDHLPER